MTFIIAGSALAIAAILSLLGFDHASNAALFFAGGCFVGHGLSYLR